MLSVPSEEYESNPVPHELASTNPASASGAPRGWRQRRVQVHLDALREPLAGLALDDRDHAVLAWLADREAAEVGALISLLTRLRAAPPD